MNNANVRNGPGLEASMTTSLWHGSWWKYLKGESAYVGAEKKTVRCNSASVWESLCCKS